MIATGVLGMVKEEGAGERSGAEAPGLGGAPIRSGVVDDDVADCGC